jgi:hypothetical protein
MVATSSPGSTGFAMCAWYPARIALVRSSALACAVSATAGILWVGPSILRICCINAYPSISRSVRRNYGVTDALQRPVEPFALGVQSRRRAFAFRDVPGDLRRTDHHAQPIADWGRGERNVDPSPILRDSDCFEVIDLRIETAATAATAEPYSKKTAFECLAVDGDTKIADVGFLRRFTTGYSSAPSLSMGPSISGSPARTRSPSCTLMWASRGAGTSAAARRRPSRRSCGAAWPVCGRLLAY